MAAEDGLHIEVKDILALIERGFETIASLAAQDHRAEFVGKLHLVLLRRGHI